MRCHVHDVELPVSPERAFALLVTPSDVRAWWSASRVIVLPKAGGTWCATWGDDEDAPDYVTTAHIAVYDPPRRLALDDYRYASKDGDLPFDAEFRTTFDVEPLPDGGARVRVTQDGFPSDPIADDFFAGCEVGWRDTFAQMKAYAETLAPKT